MNRSFLIIFIPALLVAAGYLYLGIRPPMRAGIGIAIFAVVVAVIRLRFMLQSKRAAGAAARSGGQQNPSGTQLPSPPVTPAPPAANHP
jgi:mannose/fructose/N-acetylgalactosamine-specific phosphotransferase system component IIC